MTTDLPSSLSTPLPFVYGKRLDDLDVLGRSTLLRGLGYRDIGVFLDLLDQVALPQGTTVIREGDAGEYMYFVLEGTGRLKRGLLDLRSIAPGDHFGELAMLDTRPRPTTMEAHTTMRLARLSRSRYRALATSHPRVALHFTQALARSLGDEVLSFTDSVGLLLHQRSVPRRLQVNVRVHAPAHAPTDTATIVATGTLVGTLLPREYNGALVVGATMNRASVGLETAVVADADLEPITLASDEGRAILIRSASLLLLEAARRLLPDAPMLSGLRMGPILDSGRVVILPRTGNGSSSSASVLGTQLETEMSRLIQEGVLLRDEVWAIDEARAELADRGAPDVASLLRQTREATTTITRCGETFALSMGPVVSRASDLASLDFTINPHPHGLFLHLRCLDRFFGADKKYPALPPSASFLRFGGPMVDAGARWLERLGIHDVGSFAHHCVGQGGTQVPELIRVAEGFHEKWIGLIADQIVSAALSRPHRVEPAMPVRVIMIAGPSSSGKTTFIKRLIVQLRIDGLRPTALSLDDYYVDRELTVRDEHGALDFEALEAIDLNLLREHLRRILAGEEVATARYDFVAGKSMKDAGLKIKLGEPNDVLLIEGIHGLNPALLPASEGISPEQVFRVFVHPAQSLSFDRLSTLAPEDARLIRRLVRDRHQRNYSAADTILRWPSVRRGELRHIFPFQSNADAIFDSSLIYELSILKTYAERYLLEVPTNHPAFTTANRLRRLLDQFVAIDADHVPPTSVIREFIGGSGFSY